MAKLKGVLLIEDDPITNFINSKLIRNMDFAEQIHIVKSGEEALIFIKNKCESNEELPELMLLDINMPVLDGFDFMMEYDKYQIPNATPPVIAILSTSSHEYDRERFMAIGITNFITKPLTREKLLTLLKDTFNM